MTFTADENILGLKDKIAVVFGGAGAGLGSAHCLELARAGCHVVVADLDAERGAEVAKEIEAIGREAVFVEADATDAAAVTVALEAAESRFGAVDIAVNNVGNPLRRSALLDYSDADFDSVLTTSMKSTFVCCRAEGLAMARQRTHGSIINISSASACVAADGFGLYGAAKAGVAQFTKTAAVEFGRFGIRVNCIAPGVIAASTSHVSPDIESFHQLSKLATVSRRLAEPREIAGLTVFLASSLSSYMTGQTLIADAGQTIRVNRPQRDRVPAVTDALGIDPIYR